MWEWFERRGQRYLRVGWLDAAALERDPRYVEVPAWVVVDERELSTDARFFRETHEGFSGSALDLSAGPGAAPSAPAESAAPAEEEGPRAWIEVELQDAQGRPVPDQTCRIKLTDGSEVEKRTDKFGVVRVDELEPGVCEVSFPELKDGSWAPI